MSLPAHLNTYSNQLVSSLIHFQGNPPVKTPHSPICSKECWAYQGRQGVAVPASVFLAPFAFIESISDCLLGCGACCVNLDVEPKRIWWMDKEELHCTRASVSMHIAINLLFCSLCDPDKRAALPDRLAAMYKAPKPHSMKQDN
jgi:hypothetical protein